MLHSVAGIVSPGMCGIVVYSFIVQTDIHCICSAYKSNMLTMQSL